MYVNPFWAGVVCTLLAEFGALFAAALLYSGKGKKK